MTAPTSDVVAVCDDDEGVTSDPPEGAGVGTTVGTSATGAGAGGCGIGWTCGGATGSGDAPGGVGPASGGFGGSGAGPGGVGLLIGPVVIIAGTPVYGLTPLTSLRVSPCHSR